MLRKCGFMMDIIRGVAALAQVWAATLLDATAELGFGKSRRLGGVIFAKGMVVMTVRE